MDTALVVLPIVVPIAVAIFVLRQTRKQTAASERQAAGVEEGNWLGQTIEFRATVKGTGADGEAKIELQYLVGPELDSVTCELLSSEDSPIVSGDGFRFPAVLGQLRVNDKRQLAVQRKLDDKAYQSGTIRLRLVCKADGHQSDVAVECELKGAPHVGVWSPGGGARRT